jgi:hypothetical protein
MATQTFAAIDQATQDVPTILGHLDDRTDTLRACFIGPSAPSSPVEGQFWLDTSGTPYILKLRADYDGGGVAWNEVNVATILSADVDYDFQEALQMRVENLGSHEAVAAGKDGFIYLLTGDGELYFVDQAVDNTVKKLCSVIAGTTTDSVDIPLSEHNLGDTPPTKSSLGTTPEVRGWLFDATAETMLLKVRVPNNYSADGNLTLRLLCMLAAAETANDDIDWSGDLLSLADGESGTGTSTALAASLTDVGANNAQGEIIECDMVIDYDDATNPVNPGDWLFIEIHRTDLAEVAGVILLTATLVYPCDGAVQ